MIMGCIAVTSRPKNFTGYVIPGMVTSYDSTRSAATGNASASAYTPHFPSINTRILVSGYSQLLVLHHRDVAVADEFDYSADHLGRPI